MRKRRFEGELTDMAAVAAAAAATASAASEVTWLDSSLVAVALSAAGTAAAAVVAEMDDYLSPGHGKSALSWLTKLASIVVMS